MNESIVRRCHITAREQDVARLLLSGTTRKEIAIRLCLSHHTVNDYIKTMMRKTHTRTASHMIVTLFGIHEQNNNPKAGES